MSQPDQNSKVTLEDLLRLKRAERPNPEFWSRFESELRQKQLTALVKKRRWWHEVPMLLNRRVYLPVGATAIVAFTLVTVRYSSPTQISQVPNTAPQIVAADPAMDTFSTTVVAMVDQVRSVSHNEPVVVASAPANVVATSGDIAPVQSVAREVDSTSARLSVANLSRLVQSEPDLTDSLVGTRLSSSARTQPAVGQSELVSMTNASASKYQLIARYADRALSPAPAAPAVVRERLARRLGDDLGDSITRIGVVGDRVSLKF